MKDKILSLLDSLDIKYENFEHLPVFTCDEAKGIELPGLRVKTLLLRNKKPNQFYLIVLRDKKQLNSNALRKLLWENKLSFASPDRMMEKIWVTPWSVSPFALINNTEKDIKVFFDKELSKKLIWFHPWQNNNTTVLEIEDVEKFLQHLWYELWYLEL